MDVSVREKDKFLKALTSENIECLFAEGDSSRFLSTGTITPNGNSSEWRARGSDGKALNELYFNGEDAGPR